MTTELLMSFLAEPKDVNFGGHVHGGEVMKWMDQIGYALAVKYSKGYAVTKFVDNINFKSPMKIGDLVSLSAKIMSVGVTSMRIEIHVKSENLETEIVSDNCSCEMVFVAVDKEGNKRSLKSTLFPG
jgi:acyl-CoA hydrolase